MLTDYKTPHITQYADGSWAVFLRIYAGAVTTEDESDSLGDMIPVTRYRRTSMLREEALALPSMPEAALQGLLRAELAKDQVRSPIVEQR